MEKREDTIRKLRIYAILMRAMEIEAERNNTCDLHSVVGSQFTVLKKTEPFLITRAMDKDRLEAMSKLGIAASKAGESLMKVTLAMKKLQKCKPPYKQWQQPYRYHR